MFCDVRGSQNLHFPLIYGKYLPVFDEQAENVRHLVFPLNDLPDLIDEAVTILLHFLTN